MGSRAKATLKDRQLAAREEQRVMREMVRRKHERAAQMPEADVEEALRKATHAAHHAEAHHSRTWLEAAKNAARPVVLAEAVSVIEAMRLKSEHYASLPPGPPPAEHPGIVASRHRTMLDDLERRGVPRKFLYTHDVDLDRDPPLLPRLGTTARAPLPPDMLAAIAGLKTLFDRPATVAFLGKRGRGKTSISAGLCRWFYARGRTAVRYATAGNYLSALSERDHETLRRFRGAQLLVLDEMQQSGDLQWRQDELFELIDGRWRNELPTLLISNKSRKGFATHVGPGVWRRMVDDGMRVFTADWSPLGPLLGESDWAAAGDDN